MKFFTTLFVVLAFFALFLTFMPKTQEVDPLDAGPRLTCPCGNKFGCDHCDGGSQIEEKPYFTNSNNQKQYSFDQFNKNCLNSLVFSMVSESLQWSVMKQDDDDCGFCYYFAAFKIAQFQFSKNILYTGQPVSTLENKLSPLRKGYNCSGGNFIATFNKFSSISFTLKSPNSPVTITLKPITKKLTGMGDLINLLPTFNRYATGMDALLNGNRYTKSWAVEMCLDNLRRLSSYQMKQGSEPLYHCINDEDVTYKGYTTNTLFQCQKPHIAFLTGVYKDGSDYLIEFQHQWKKNENSTLYGSKLYVLYNGNSNSYPCRLGFSTAFGFDSDARIIF